MRSTFTAFLRAIVPGLRCRSITSSSLLSSPSSRNPSTANTNADANDGSCSPGSARVKPKVYNSNIWGSSSDPGSQLTEDQKEEVMEYNRYFAKKHHSEIKEKVDDKFWTGHSKD